MWFVPLVYVLIGLVLGRKETSLSGVLWSALFWPAQLTPPLSTAQARLLKLQTRLRAQNELCAHLAATLASPGHDAKALQARIDALSLAKNFAAAEAVRCHLAEVERAESRLDDLKATCARLTELERSVALQLELGASDKDVCDLLDAAELG